MATKKYCDLCGIECTSDPRIIGIQYGAFPTNAMRRHVTMFNGKSVGTHQREIKFDVCPICKQTLDIKQYEAAQELAKSNGRNLDDIDENTVI